MSYHVNDGIDISVAPHKPRKFYTGIDVSDRGEADIVSLFHISEANS